MRLLLATRNEHKRREFARLMPGVQVDALPERVVLPPEDGDTFEHNAVVKARAAAAATGRIAIADDSGIEAEALAGAPGVRSARYAGEAATDEENLRKLLAEAPTGSGLRYVCALAYVDPAGGVERIFEGTCHGTLTGRPRGARGFGYDPAFVPDEQPESATQSDADGAVRSGMGAAAQAEAGANAISAMAGADHREAGAADRSEAGAAALPRSGSEQRMTMAELRDDQKDAISHRGRAARALIAWLRESRSTAG